jgi:molecular chaperone HtpG
VKNIQVGGTTIFDEIFASIKPSYARLNAYYVGEVHINPSLLIPNARRDGFEDTLAWRNLKRELAKDLCAGLAKRAYDLSEDRQKGIEKIEANVKKLVKSTEKYATQGEESEERFKLLYTNAQIREKIVAALGDAIPETQLRFKSQLAILDVARKRLSKEIDGDVSETRKRIVEQVLEQVLSILQTYLGPEMFSTVRKALKNKIK